MKRGWLLRTHTPLVYVFLYAPIAILVLFSFNRTSQTAVWQGFTLDWYRNLLHDELILASVRNSLVVGVATTVVATVIGTLAALALGRFEFRGKGATQNLLYLPIIIPEIVIGAALVTFFGAARLRLSILTVVIAHVVFSISYVAIVVRARLSGFDRSLEEAALDLGARPVQTLLPRDPAADPAGDRRRRASGLHGLDRRLRHHVLRGRSRRHDPAAPDLLDAEGRGHARGQRRLDASARRDRRADRRRPAAAAAASRAVRGMRSLRIAAAVLVAVAALALPSCAPSGDEPPYPGPGEKKLNVYIWSEYLPQEVIDEFTKRTGIQVRYDLYDSNEPVLAKLQSGVADYDLVVPSDYMVRILSQLKLLRPIEKARLKNLGNLDPRFLDQEFDPGNVYSLPYVWGTTGSATRRAGPPAGSTAGRRSSTPRTPAGS